MISATRYTLLMKNIPVVVVFVVMVGVVVIAFRGISRVVSAH